MTTPNLFVLLFIVLVYAVVIVSAIRNHKKKMKETQAAFDETMAELQRTIDAILKKR